MNPMTEERIARNDSILRDVNEQINAEAREHNTDDAQGVPFICECADEHCTLVVRKSGRAGDIAASLDRRHPGNQSG
jgi:hypothetical protein